MDIIEILKDLYKTKNIQEWINHRFSSETHFVIEKGKHIIEVDGIKFYLDDMFLNIDSVNMDYNFDDLKPTDIVLDIGANIGAFSLKIAPKVKHVYAVEPTMTERLIKNIKLNNIKNITVLDNALGDGNVINISWMRTYNKKIKSNTLTELINMCGGHIDWLKCDCEGAEWYIKPEELIGIRRIEAEIHMFKGMPHVDKFLPILENSGFNYEVTDLNNDVAIIIHAKSKTIKTIY